MKTQRFVLTICAVAVVSMFINMARASMAKEQVFNLGDENFKVEIVTNGVRFIPEYGPRFDNTAHVNDVWIGSKSFLKSGDGLIDEFGIFGIGVLNFEHAKIGEKFIKIGVGIGVRDTNDAYMFWHKYPVDEVWPAECNQASNNELVLCQTSKEVGGYAYRYWKQYRVDPNTKTLTITYTLSNCGKVFEFQQYDHNWFCFSGLSIGPGYYVETDFDAVPDGNATDWLQSESRKLMISRAITTGSYYPVDIKVPSRTNHFTVANDTCNQSVDVSGDFEIRRFALFAEPAAICPEVFLQEKLEVNQSRTWKRTYHFKVK